MHGTMNIKFLHTSSCDDAYEAGKFFFLITKKHKFHSVVLEVCKNVVTFYVRKQNLGIVHFLDK